MSDQETPAPPCQPISQEEFYARHVKSLRSFFRRQGFASADVDELAHDAFVRAFAGWGKVRCASWTWLARVATNVWKNELRRRHTGKRAGLVVELDAGKEATHAPEANAIIERLTQKEQASVLVAAIASLPPRMRECLLLRVQHGLTMREIAERLGITEGAVKAQIHEAREQLKRLFGKAGPSPGKS